MYLIIIISEKILSLLNTENKWLEGKNMKKMVINFFNKSFLTISIVLLLLSVYLNISIMVSDDSRDSYYMAREKINSLGEGHIY